MQFVPNFAFPDLLWIQRIGKCTNLPQNRLFLQFNINEKEGKRKTAAQLFLSLYFTFWLFELNCSNYSYSTLLLCQKVTLCTYLSFKFLWETFWSWQIVSLTELKKSMTQLTTNGEIGLINWFLNKNKKVTRTLTADNKVSCQTEIIKLNLNNVQVSKSCLP